MREYDLWISCLSPLGCSLKTYTTVDVYTTHGPEVHTGVNLIGAVENGVRRHERMNSGSSAQSYAGDVKTRGVETLRTAI